MSLHGSVGASKREGYHSMLAAGNVASGDRGSERLPFIQQSHQTVGQKSMRGDFFLGCAQRILPDTSGAWANTRSDSHQNRKTGLRTLKQPLK